MTCIAVKVGKNKITLGADEMVSSYHKSNINDYNTTKMHQINNEFAFGGAGDLAEINMFYNYTLTHTPRDANELALIEYMDDFCNWKSKRGREYSASEIHLIIVFKGLVFRFAHNSIYSITKFDAIGTGAPYAYTALHLGHSIEEAVLAAIDLDHYCGGNIQLIEMAVQHA